MGDKNKLIRIHDNSYWHANFTRFKNKFKALESVLGNEHLVSFFYANSSFEKIDWTCEPTQTWQSMMVQRAHQIRENFDYIRLWYSGGADSQTILDVFLAEKIHLDEICCHLVSPIDDFLSYNNIEQNKVAIPFLEHIKQSIPKTKITINYLGRDHYNSVFTDGWLYENFDMSMIQDQPGSLYKSGIVHSAGGNFCDLQGGDKPVVIKEDNNYYCLMVDETFAPRINSEHVEEFFTSPNFPEMHAKQCHMTINYLQEKYPDQQPGVVNNSLRKEIEKNTGMRTPLFKNIDQGKESSNVIGDKSLSLLDQAKQGNRVIYDKWQKSLEYEAGRHTDRFNDGDIYKGFRGILSGKFRLNS